MFIPFDNLPDQARIWIYQSDRRISPEQQELIESALIDFASDWKAHGQPLEASFTVLNNYFVVIGVNEEKAGASGCSIDASFNVMKQITAQTGIDFFNRTLVPFFIDNELRQFELQELKQKFRDGILTQASLTFNTLAETAGTLRQNWKIPASDSWLKRYIEPRTVDSIGR